MSAFHFFLLALTFSAAPAYAAPECVNVFYDRSPQPGYWMGRTYSQLLQNLLGHFPELQQIVSPIELYRKGDLDRCRASIYIGSHFDTEIPAEFFEDYRRTKKNVAWLGYNIWRLNDLEELFGYKYERLTTLDEDLRDENGHPTFYKNIDYKGETFHKYGDWSRDDPDIFLAPFEQVELVETRPGVSKVLAVSWHSGTGIEIPYALRAKNRFYIADVPFSFLHEADRYLVFADLLFDIVDLPPRHREHYAFVRVEDIHPLVPLPFTYDTVNLLKAENIPLVISLVPIFFDPLHAEEGSKQREFVPMTEKPEFLSFLRELMPSNPTFIWHGVTHQHGRRKNPHDGMSGSDFEFWDAVNNRQVPEDSVRWVLDRLRDGIDIWRKSKLPDPVFWLTPHYQASTLDYSIFAKALPWNVGRVIYFNHRTTGRARMEDESLLHITSRDPEAAKIQEKYFSGLKIALESGSPWSGQLFPYEIYGDVHGQRLIPENLGNSQPFVGNHVIKSRTVEQMLADAKRNLVLRDAWGSFFYHPYLLMPYEHGGRGSYPGDPAELRRLVRGVKALGYKFIDLKDFAKKQTRTIRPEPIYRD